VWANQRNFHEVHTLAKLIDHLMANRSKEALELAARRVVGVMEADRTKSWDVAEQLAPATDSLVPRTVLRDAYRAAARERQVARQLGVGGAAVAAGTARSAGGAAAAGHAEQHRGFDGGRAGGGYGYGYGAAATVVVMVVAATVTVTIVMGVTATRVTGATPSTPRRPRAAVVSDHAHRGFGTPVESAGERRCRKQQ